MTKYRVVLPEKSSVRAVKCCLESMLELHKANPDSRITGFRIKPERTWEIETEETSDGKETPEATT